jgi:hypothetical protein
VDPFTFLARDGRRAVQRLADGLRETGIDILLTMRSQVRLANHWRDSYTACATTTDSQLEGATGRKR